MEEKHIALCILAIVAIIAIAGLMLHVAAGKEGAAVAAGKPYKYIYPGGVASEIEKMPAAEPAKLPSPQEYYQTTG